MDAMDFPQAGGFPVTIHALVTNDSAGFLCDRHCMSLHAIAITGETAIIHNRYFATIGCRFPHEEHGTGDTYSGKLNSTVITTYNSSEPVLVISALYTNF